MNTENVMVKVLFAIGKTFLVFALVGVLVVVVNVFFSFFTFSQHTRAEPARTDLVGIWIPDRRTVEDMQERGGYNPTFPTSLRLQADGSFEMINFPDWWSNISGQSYGGLRNNSGTWEISEQENLWHVELKLTGTRRSVDLLGQKQPYSISFVLGDPDSGKSMTFIKKSE